MIVYLVRHAEYKREKNLTEGELVHRGLTKFGRLQALALAKKIRRLGVNKIYSSPIARARETAEIIKEQTGIPLEYRSELREFFTDLNSRDINITKTQKERARQDPSLVFPSGESLLLAINRLESFLEELSLDLDEPVALVGHRVVIEGLLARLFNLRPYDHEWLRYASVCALEYHRARQPELIFYDKRFFDFRLVCAILVRRIKSLF